jgi:hypothetical protein
MLPALETHKNEFRGIGISDGDLRDCLVILYGRKY